MRKVLPLILIVICLGASFVTLDFLPEIGDPSSKPNTHTTDYYIEHATTETNAANMVTAVIVVTTVYSGVEYFVKNWNCLWN